MRGRSKFARAFDYSRCENGVTFCVLLQGVTKPNAAVAPRPRSPPLASSPCGARGERLEGLCRGALRRDKRCLEHALRGARRRQLRERRHESLHGAQPRRRARGVARDVGAARQQRQHEHLAGWRGGTVASRALLGPQPTRIHGREARHQHGPVRHAHGCHARRARQGQLRGSRALATARAQQRAEVAAGGHGERAGGGGGGWEALERTHQQRAALVHRAHTRQHAVGGRRRGGQMLGERRARGRQPHTRDEHVQHLVAAPAQHCAAVRWRRRGLEDAGDVVDVEQQIVPVLDELPRREHRLLLKRAHLVLIAAHILGVHADALTLARRDLQHGFRLGDRRVRDLAEAVQRHVGHGRAALAQAALGRAVGALRLRVAQHRRREQPRPLAAALGRQRERVVVLVIRAALVRGRVLDARDLFDLMRGHHAAAAEPAPPDVEARA
mmetsp:Transcript_11963/g.50346  ORF Transcript_11963/g.50346 Transcript_11963/m.50346 type:complete len:442 (+) Transcript_11963:696-2021(+)